jgi:plastocyanin
LRPRAALLAAGVLATSLLAAAGLGEAHTRRARPEVCHRRHHRRVCATPHARPHRPAAVTTTTTTTSATTTGATPAATSVTTTSSSSAAETTTSQTSTSSTSAPSLPHGTQIDERATGEQSPFYALDAGEHTLAAGSIHFNIYNYDQDPHTFAIADSNGNQITNAVAVPAGQPDTPVTVTVNLQPGTYTLFCTLPQHAALGMETTIVVK